MERRTGRGAPKPNKRIIAMVAGGLLVLLCVISGIVAWRAGKKGGPGALERLEAATLPGWVDVQLIEVDGASRRGEPLEGFADIVVHYIGNPGTTAQQNHDYFANADSTVSAHFVIGLEGEVIQCVPLSEKSSASNERNRDTISIEVCHPDEGGAFTDASYQRLVELTAWLCEAGGLGRDNIIRHYDVTGKLCPLYYVEHQDAWEGFKGEVAARL